MLTEHRRLWQRTRRAKAASRNRCRTCAIHEAEWPWKYCTNCLESSKRSNQKQRNKRRAA